MFLYSPTTSQFTGIEKGMVYHKTRNTRRGQELGGSLVLNVFQIFCWDSLKLVCETLYE